MVSMYKDWQLPSEAYHTGVLLYDIVCVVLCHSLSDQDSSSPHPAGLIVSLQLLRGDMEQIRRENQILFNRGAAVTRKLGFPDVIMPGRGRRRRLNCTFTFLTSLIEKRYIFFVKKYKSFYFLPGGGLNWHQVQIKRTLLWSVDKGMSVNTL